MSVINVKVITKSSENKIIKEDENNFKIKVTETPINGKANEAVINLIHKEFKIPKSKIKILKGFNSSNKIILIDCVLE